MREIAPRRTYMMSTTGKRRSRHTQDLVGNPAGKANSQHASPAHVRRGPASAVTWPGRCHLSTAEELLKSRPPLSGTQESRERIDQGEMQRAASSRGLGVARPWTKRPRILGFGIDGGAHPPTCIILTHRVRHSAPTSTSSRSGQRFLPFGRKTRPSSASSFTWLLLGQFGLSATRPLSHLS